MERERTFSTARPQGAAGGAQADVFDNGRLRVEHDNYYVSCGGQRISLSLKEFLILSRLARSPERVVPSNEIWRHAWGSGEHQQTALILSLS